MPELIPTIGLEIHAELATKSKMWCGCKNDPDLPAQAGEKRPNVNVCPVCLAHPGTLPVANKEAVRSVLRVGLALGGEVADFSEFDRKNYFYPDIPKGYQISQYKHPLVRGGELRGVKITRVHLEEDTGTSKHDQGDFSLVDFNRAGVPLMELVTEPVLHSAKEAADFAREFQLVLRYLDVAEANMEKGEMRVEANISVATPEKNSNGFTRLVAGSDADHNFSPAALGTKVEVKNLNSFRAVEKAIEFEIKRQSEVLARGEPVVQETRGWDEIKGITFSQRQKEESHDYRYFPDPDLPKLKIGELEEFKNLKETIPELPQAKRERLTKLGIQAQDVEQYVGDPELSKFFDAAAAELKTLELIKISSNFIANDIAGQRRKEPDWPLPSLDHFVTVMRCFQSGELASPQAKSSILSGTMAKVADNESLHDLVGKTIAANPKVVGDFQQGKEAALQFLIGQGMKESHGAANPEALKKLFTERLGKPT